MTGTNGPLELVHGQVPKRVSRESVVGHLLDRLSDHETKLLQLWASAAQLGLGDIGGASSTGPTLRGSSDGALQAAEEALAAERAGRAAAEARIDELKRDLRRANRAINALMPHPDEDDPRASSG